MKIMALSIAVLALLTVFPKAEAEDGFGLGVILGEPTGISFKNWSGGDKAIAGGLAWSFSGYEAVNIHLDYLIHRNEHFQTDDLDGNIPFYFGLGGRVKLAEDRGTKDDRHRDSLVGLRIPLGLAYQITDPPIDLFFEIVPILDIVPDTDFDLNAAIGARYYF